MSYSIKKDAIDLDLASSLIDRPDFLTQMKKYDEL